MVRNVEHFADMMSAVNIENMDMVHKNMWMERFLNQSNKFDEKEVFSITYTEKEVEELLKTQRGNCYVAILSKTENEEFAKVANSAPEPSGGKWRKTIRE